MATHSSLARVAGNIQDLIVEFADNRIKSGAVVFRMTELTEYVSSRTTVAPDSPGRIMRMLKRSGVINYTLEDRAKSLYKLVRI